MNSHKVEKSKSPLEEKERMDKEGRLKLIREEWYIQQELERKHEARKLEMIEDYERRRAQELKIDHKQKSLRRSKSNSPQRRTTDYKYLEKLKISPSKYKKNIIIDEKELCKIKVNIYKERVCQTSQNISKNEIERHIDNLDDIVLPRRKDEGSRPIFEKIKAAEDETRTIRFLRDNKLEKQLSDEERIDTCKSTPFDTYKTVIQYSGDSHSAIYLDVTEYNNAELQARTKEYYHYYHNHYFLSYLDFILHRSKSLSNLSNKFSFLLKKEWIYLIMK